MKMDLKLAQKGGTTTISTLMPIFTTEHSLTLFGCTKEKTSLGVRFRL